VPTVFKKKIHSGFHAHHSTEKALVEVVNDLRANTDAKQLSVHVLLGLSVAFDTVDHDVVLDRLKRWLGLSGPVLNWFRTYLTGQELSSPLVNITQRK
jgi:hypothetical protein